MSKELTPENEEWVNKEAREYADLSSTDIDEQMFSFYAYKAARIKSITEIQELRENLRLALENAKDMTIRRDHWMQVNGSNERLIDKLNEHKAERDQKITAMGEYIKALEARFFKLGFEPWVTHAELRDKAGL